jgi:alpha-glucosidase
VYCEGEKIIVEIATREGQFLISEREVIVEVVGVGEQRFTDDGTVRRLTFDSFGIKRFMLWWD